jgi:GDP-fucose transporter C1
MFATVTSNHVKVAGVVLFYMSSALVMVFVNKAVLNSSPELPLLFLLLQLMLAVILLHLAALVSDRVEIPKLEVESAKKLTPVILVNVIGLVFNTLCLRDVEASFFQIARGLVLPLTIIVSSLNTHTTPTSRTIFAAVIVTVGFLLGVAPSAAVPAHVAPSILSLFYGVLSSLFIALHAVLIKSSLPHCGNSTIQLAYWTNAGSVIFLAPFIMFNGELVKLRVLTETPSWNGHIFLWGSLITGVFGFLLCVAGLLSIKVTSPITHMFSSAARSVLQTILGVWLFKDILTTNRASSIFVILLGTMYFTWVKSKESAPPQPPKVDVEAQEIMKRSSRDSESDTVVWEVPEKESKH